MGSLSRGLRAGLAPARIEELPPAPAPAPAPPPPQPPPDAAALLQPLLDAPPPHVEPEPPEPAEPAAVPSDDALAALLSKAGMSEAELRAAESLDLSGKRINDDDCGVLAHLLTTGECSCARLTLNNNNIGDVGIIALCEPLGAGALPALWDLAAGDNHIGDRGALALSMALRRGALPNLALLLLYSNVLTSEGAAAIAAAFACSAGALESLSWLYLGGNVTLGDAGVRSLCSAFTTYGAAPALNELSLYSAGITDEGALELARALRNGALPELDTLDLEGNEISPQVQRAVYDALEVDVQDR